MNVAYEIANKHSSTKKELMLKKQKGKLAEPLSVGDKVLVRNMEMGGPGKLRSYWIKDIYIVQDVKSNGVVYTVAKEDGSGKWTVHRNMLLPCSHLILPESSQEQKHEQKRVTRQSLRARLPDIQEETAASDSDSDEETIVYRPVQPQ